MPSVSPAQRVEDVVTNGDNSYSAPDLQNFDESCATVSSDGGSIDRRGSSTPDALNDIDGFFDEDLLQLLSGDENQLHLHDFSCEDDNGDVRLVVDQQLQLHPVFPDLTVVSNDYYSPTQGFVVAATAVPAVNNSIPSSNYAQQQKMVAQAAPSSGLKRKGDVADFQDNDDDEDDEGSENNKGLTDQQKANGRR